MVFDYEWIASLSALSNLNTSVLLFRGFIVDMNCQHSCLDSSYVNIVCTAFGAVVWPWDGSQWLDFWQRKIGLVSAMEQLVRFDVEEHCVKKWHKYEHETSSCGQKTETWTRSTKKAKLIMLVTSTQIFRVLVAMNVLVSRKHRHKKQICEVWELNYHIHHILTNRPHVVENTCCFSYVLISKCYLRNNENNLESNGKYAHSIYMWIILILYNKHKNNTKNKKNN